MVIDNGAPYGDAAVDIPGFDFKLLPVSGVGALVEMDYLGARDGEDGGRPGDPPQRCEYIAALDRKAGQDYYEKSRAEFNRRGY